MKPLPIFGTGIKSISPFITAQRRVNVYYDIRPDGDKSQIAIISRPGLTLYVTLPTLPIRGMIQVGQFAYAVGGAVLYVISPYGGYAPVGSLNTVTPTVVSMAFNQNQLCIVDGSFGYVLNNLSSLTDLIINSGEAQQAQTLANYQFLRDIQTANIP